MKKLILIIALISSCNASKIPSTKLSQCQLNHSYHFTANQLVIELTNPLKCPLRTWVNIEDDSLRIVYKDVWPIVLNPMSDTTFTIAVSDTNFEVKFASLFGDTAVNISPKSIELPFDSGQSYSLVQGYNSTPSHNTPYSRYALDFGLPIGDTVCAATDGYVIGVIEGYKNGGKDKKWRPYANFITIYQPSSGLFFQYVHLQYEGALVQVGDEVQVNQPIGISGLTGYTTTPHLHFNILRPVHSKKGMESFPVDSIGHFSISQLKRHQMIEK